MELGTFGAIMTFALEVENQVASFYESTKEKVNDNELAGLFESLANRGQKRIKIIEQIRRENITEMILEPITGLDSDTFRPVTSISEEISDNILKDMAKAIENKLHAFYTAATSKIDFLIEVAYSFDFLAEANEEASKRLAL